MSDIRGGHRIQASTCWVSGGRSWPEQELAPTVVVDDAAEALALIQG